MTDPAIIAWIESAPGPFEAASMMDVWCKAYADYYGKNIDGFDLGFMLMVEGCGHLLRPTPSRGWILEITP